MRYTTSQYAQGLLEALKKSADTHATVKKFVSLLVRDGKLAKARAIMLDFEELLEQESGKQKIEITSARKLEATHAVRAALGEKASVEEKVDPRVLGGMRIRVGDELVDNTIQKRLSDLRHTIAN